MEQYICSQGSPNIHDNGLPIHRSIYNGCIYIFLPPGWLPMHPCTPFLKFHPEPGREHSMHLMHALDPWWWSLQRNSMHPMHPTPSFYLDLDAFPSVYQDLGAFSCTQCTWRHLALGRMTRHAPMHTPFYFFISNPPLEEMWFHAHPYPICSLPHFVVHVLQNILCTPLY